LTRAARLRNQILKCGKKKKLFAAVKKSEPLFCIDLNIKEFLHNYFSDLDGLPVQNAECPRFLYPLNVAFNYHQFQTCQKQ
jgi:hypothetical protein